MSLKKTLELFTSYPRASIFLALLCILLGVVSISGIVPVSENRRYFPGHEWLLFLLSWVLAVLFGYCGFKGLRTGS
jgi:cytochrome c oxidase assembly factor CtaG